MIKAVSDEEGAPLSERTYRELRRLLLTNQLRPGSRLTYAEVAERLEVSRTPVREALERLRQEGFVERIPRRGFLVTDMDPGLAAQLYQMREALEPFALGLAMGRGIDEATLRRLDEMVDAYGDLVEKGAIARRRELDRDFHLSLVRLSGNAYLEDVLARVFEKLLLKFRIEGYYHVERGPLATQEHRTLLKSIRAGHLPTAQEILRTHIHAAGLGFEKFLSMSSSAES